MGFEILGHPLTNLKTHDVVEYKTKEATNLVTITGGVVEVLKNKVIVLADGTV